jgi:hypothetical protein
LATIENDGGVHYIKPHIATIKTIIAEIFEQASKSDILDRTSLIDAG